ncbi:TPA: LPXTG cell wall anchor domain-containing protein [Enterococcus faecium]|nr:LPXTG cell wall anchor domain-containing protein [Enterococcus faecium]HAZ0832592.1 LPXTG cell wall anchor domain-containing protein [Enterococcus faecium]HAZ0854594.1 LPXTG cell wall anchor domain-containing protein [Enterococcus faecium]HAZ0875085.1 LPXTG cell wall anchor domain-containing protein [Enterococcus faecium]HAZ0880883.1 LPXTG cell wall anchor domain-containing protein [Enterococcus faecium]
MYFELKLSLGLLSEAYLDLGNGKMFYLIDPKLAPYVDKITFERSLMSDGIAEKDSTEIPEADYVWSSGILTTQNGPIRAALAGSTSSTYKIFLKREVPDEVFENSLKFGMWARYSSKTDMIEDFSKNLILNNNLSRAQSTSNYFSDKDIVGNDGPILDSMLLNYKNNSISTRYRINGSIIGDNSKFSLHITTSPELIDLIDKIEIGGHQYLLANGSLEKSNEKDELIVNNIAGKNGFLSRLSNRQDFDVIFKIKEGKKISDALTGKNDKFSFDFKIYDGSSQDVVLKQVDTVTNNISLKSYQTGSSLGNKTWNLKLFKDNLERLISNKKQDLVGYNPSFSQKITEELKDPYEAVNIATQSPSAYNIYMARSLINITDKKELDKNASWFRNQAKDELLSILDAAEKVYQFTKTRFRENVNDFPGLLLKNTTAGTYIDAQDSDKDGVLDITEIDNSYGLNPSVVDTDGDGVSDGEEMLKGTDPGVAPFNWYNSDNKKISLTDKTKSISGSLTNNSYYKQVMQPRKVTLYKVVDGEKKKIKTVDSNKDFKGSFEFTDLNLKDGDKLVIGYVTPESKEKDDILQREFLTEQFSEILTVKNKVDWTEITPVTAINPDQVTPETVHKGDPVDLTDNITGLPEGSKVEVVSPVDPNKVGEQTGKVFPKTGEKNTNILTIFGGLLLFGSLGLIDYKNKKSKNN